FHEETTFVGCGACFGSVRPACQGGRGCSNRNGNATGDAGGRQTCPFAPPTCAPTPARAPSVCPTRVLPGTGLPPFEAPSAFPRRQTLAAFDDAASPAPWDAAAATAPRTRLRLAPLDARRHALTRA